MDTLEFKKAIQQLSKLGITSNYVGFYVTAYAISLSIREPERLILVGKWLYPDVAKQFNTNAACIERNIRTVCELAWKKNSQLLCEMSYFNLSNRPSNSKFLSIISLYLSSN